MPAKFIIIGATGAIGSSLAKKLFDHHYPLHLIARNQDEVTQLAQSFNATFSIADVMQPQTLQQAIQEGIDDEGCLGLAYCVGNIIIKPLGNISEIDMIDCFRLNTVGAMLSIQAAKQALKKANGSVVLFSSVAADRGFANHVVISTAKAAIEGLVHATAAELAPHVRVNAIAPSLTNTKMAQKFFSQANIVDHLSQLHPLKRLGEPNDIADAAFFLLSPQSSWISGQILHVDGGRINLDVAV